MTDYTILVNRHYRLSKDMVPQNLCRVPVPFPASLQKPDCRMEEQAASQALALFRRSQREHLHLTAISGYRSYEYQNTLYQNYKNKQDRRCLFPDTCSHDILSYVAPPGASEHQTGLALDISCPAISYRLTEDFADTKEGKWLAAHARLYGFIIRYPKGKEKHTGYPWEPWHIRYVTKPLAAYLTLTGLTLEEYYDMNPVECTEQ